MSKQDGRPAFPMVGDPQAVAFVPGMSLLDYFAGQALVGMLLAKNDDALHVHVGACAKASYVVAAAMLKERAASDDSPLPPDSLDLGDKVGRS